MPARQSSVLLRLATLALPHRWWLLFTLLSVVLSGALVVITPWLIGYAIDSGLSIQDDGSSTGSMRTVVIASALLIGVAVVRSVVVFVQSYLGERVSQFIAYDLRNRIYDHLQNLSFSYHDEAQIGEVMSRATQDVEAVRFFVSMGLIRLIYVVGLLLVTAALMLTTNWRVGAVALAFVPIVSGIAIFTSVKMRPVWRAIQDIQGDLANVLQENLTGQRVVKAFSREQHEEAKFAHEAERLFERSYYSSRVMAFTEPTMNALWLISLGLVFWVGGTEVIAGRMAEGQLVTFMLYLTLLQVPVRTMGFIVGIVSRAHGAGSRIFELLDTESAVRERPGARPLQPGPGEVRFEDVSFGYDAVSPVLHGVDIHARPGETVALLGPTGSGKTTVVNLQPRFYDATGGRVTIDGEDVRDVTLDSLRASVGLVQQDVFLFAATIRDNIAYGRPDASDEDVERAARAARIHDFIDRMPQRYETWVGERGVTLSGGQKQRIAIARTLLLDPRILVLDDATSSVDTQTEYLIQDALRELMRGRTTFVIAQRLRTVQQADQILVLRDGRIEERGTHAELLERGGLYGEIYDLELRDQEEAALDVERSATANGDGGALPGNATARERAEAGGA